MLLNSLCYCVAVALPQVNVFLFMKKVYTVHVAGRHHLSVQRIRSDRSGELKITDTAVDAYDGGDWYSYWAKVKYR